MNVDHRSLAVVLSSALILLLSGCSASLPIALPEAAPSTTPDSLTALQAQQPEGTAKATASPSAEKAKASAALTAETPESTRPKPSETAKAAPAPKPTRTPPAVLRLWVAPWEDADGNLHGANDLYTEVLPRRWQLDGALLPAIDVLQPLQRVERSQSNALP